MANVCNHCKANNVKLKCSRCRDAYYCNANCQRSGWKYHKSQCQRKITIPVALNVDMNKIEKHQIKKQNIKEIRQHFSHRNAYSSITNTQCIPSGAMLELLTDILLSPLTFWSVQSIFIVFIPSKNEKPISAAIIRNFFYVASKLPKLTEFRIEDMDGGRVYPQTFNIRKGYIESFQADTYQALTVLFIPIDDVFYSSFDYSGFSSFIENACKIRDVDVNLRYWGPYQYVANDNQMRSHLEATKHLLTCISLRDSKGLSIERLAFGIGDCLQHYIDVIDEPFSDMLFELLHNVITSQSDLYCVRLEQRMFTPALQNALLRGLANKVKHLQQLSIEGHEMRPDREAFGKTDDLLALIAGQKRVEFITLDGYVCWCLDDLKKLVKIINRKCKQIEFFRCGWVEFESIEVENIWKMLMELFANNNKMTLLYFTPFAENQFDLLPDTVRDIICDAVIQCVFNFNDFMVKSQAVLNPLCEGQKLVIQEIFNFLKDDEGDVIHIVLSCPGGEFEFGKGSWSSKAVSITKYVNDKIKQVKNQKQLTYVKTFNFRVY